MWTTPVFFLTPSRHQSYVSRWVRDSWQFLHAQVAGVHSQRWCRWECSIAFLAGSLTSVSHSNRRLSLPVWEPPPPNNHSLALLLIMTHLSGLVKWLLQGWRLPRQMKTPHAAPVTCAAGSCWDCSDKPSEKVLTFLFCFFLLSFYGSAALCSFMRSFSHQTWCITQCWWFSLFFTFYL